ncbi:MAG: hypothetical protein IKS10_01085 [Lachnospiraceae bacterium]|nr:hypothetical protein [Lachnospiraceae bacterium]
MTCKFCGSPLPDGAMICDLCGNNQKASKPVDAFSFGATPAPQKKGKPADRWNTGPSASMEGASMDDINPVPVKRKKSHGSFPIKKLLAVLCVLVILGGLGFGAWWFINNRSVDQNEEIAESFKKLIRAKNAGYSVTVTASALGQKEYKTYDGGYSFNKSDSRYVTWINAEGETIVNLLTPDAGYRINMTSERYYNLYLSNPGDFPNKKIIMILDKCYEIETLAAEANSYKQMEDLFSGKLLDEIEKEQEDPEVLAALTPEERKYYDAGKKLEKEFTDPDFIKDVLNAKRNTVNGSIVYEFDVDIPELMKRLYSSIEDMLPAEEKQMAEQMKNLKKEDIEKSGIKLTGRLTITDGYFSIGIINFKMSALMEMDIDLRATNPGKTEIPEDVRQMVDAVYAK